MNTIFNIYDVADHLAQASLPDGTKWLYGYDRLSQVVSGERVIASTGAPVDGGSFRYAYDGVGNRVVAMQKEKILDFDIFEALSMTKSIDTSLYDTAMEISI